MLQGGNPLTVGVGIVIEVIRKNNSDYDLDNQVGPEPKTSDPIYLGTLLRQFAQHVPDFMRLIRSPSSKKPDLKAAFGAKIEPLGFDRFKTCELMAELLHCSNMGLLNDRGAEAEIRQRDAERERLKADGKLLSDQTPTQYQDTFASSVDSHGFHHAEMPSDDLSGSPDEIKRLEVQNVSDEDGYEKVAVPDTEPLPDEVTFDDFNEKLEEASLPPLTKSADTSSIHHVPQDTEGEGSKTPTGLEEKMDALTFASPEEEATDDDAQPEDKRRISLLTQQLQQQIHESELEHPSDQPSTPEATQGDADALQHPEDKPAPLFGGKGSPTKQAHDEPSTSQVEDQNDSPSQSTATLQPMHSFEKNDDDRPMWEADSDGTPVVGDLLKIMFVEHQVVPTILVCFLSFLSI